MNTYNFIEFIPNFTNALYINIISTLSSLEHILIINKNYFQIIQEGIVKWLSIMPEIKVSSYNCITYYWLHLNFVRVGKLYNIYFKTWKTVYHATQNNSLGNPIIQKSCFCKSTFSFLLQFRNTQQNANKYVFPGEALQNFIFSFIILHSFFLFFYLSVTKTTY
jgi:hypothetical protein